MMRPLDIRRNLGTRIFAFAMLTSGAALALAATVFSLYAYRLGREGDRRDMDAQAAILAANLSAAAAFGDTEHARTLLQTLASQARVLSACLFNNDGVVHASYGPPKPDAARPRIPANIGPEGAIAESGGILRVWRPVVHRGDTFGILCLEATARVDSERLAGAVRLGVSVLALSWVFAAWLAFRLRQNVYGPVRDLARVVQQVADHRDYTVRATKTSNDVIGELADGFNAMLDQIRARDAALRETQEGLERRVDERTRDLSAEIVERRRIEAALGEEKERLDVTLRSIGEAVIATDREGRIVLFNPVAEQMTACSASNAIGRPLAESVRLLHEKSRASPHDIVEQVIRKGEALDLREKVLVRNADTVERIVSCTASPIRGRDGAVVGVVLAIRDVTEQRRSLEESLRISKLESIGLLAGGIAHDFNNILVIIMGNVSMARLHASAQGPLTEALVAAEKASVRAAALTRQLLTFAKGGAPARRSASLHECIRDTADFILHGTKVAVRYAIAPDLWPAEVDIGQINQVIHNIILNAVQAMPDGGVLHIAAENTVLDEKSGIPLAPGRYVSIRIQDTGVGIGPPDLERVFDPYFTTKKDGVGLGLATVHSIVRRHDGHISVESTVGLGTTFRICLPAGAHPPSAKTETPAPRGGCGRILVMDDEPAILRLVEAMLHELGYEPETALEGVDAIQRFFAAKKAGKPFAAVILDLTVPGGLGGKETISRLREMDPAIKALVSSGYSDDPVMARHKEFGFDGVVAKPYTVGEIAEALARVIEDKPVPS
jgi:PAS domain S-box-containing protein